MRPRRRFIVLVRLGVMVVFLRWRCLNPNPDAYPLWLASVICEIWFGLSWILDQIPKWSPIDRETYLSRLALKSVAAQTCARPVVYWNQDGKWWKIGCLRNLECFLYSSLLPAIDPKTGSPITDLS